MSQNSAIRLLALCSLAAGLAAQQSRPQYSVAGVVINAKTGEAIKRAQVRLTHASDLGLTHGRGFGTAPLPVIILSTFTDSAGTFRFSVVPAGACILSAQKPQFTQSDSKGMPVQLQLDASAENVMLTLAPLGVITGKVLNQDGEPMRNVNVIALSQSIQDGMRQNRSVRNVGTDDRGMYRLWNLTPGNYYVKAAGKTGGTNLYAGDTPPWYLADEAFAPTYSGGGDSLDAAQQIRIEVGTEASADLKLTMLPAFKIRGSLENFVPRRAVRFELLKGDEDVSASRVSVNGDTGTFEIQDVLPGSYTLHATQNTASGEVPISVGQADLSGVALQISPAVDIQIHQQLTNPPDTQDVSDRGRDASCSVALHPAGRRAGPSFNVNPSFPPKRPGDETVLPNVQPGSYRTIIQCIGGYIKSAMFGDQDLLVNPVITVQPAVSPVLNLVATRGGGTLYGTMAIENNPREQFSILLVPQVSSGAGPIMQIGHGNEFTFQNLAPGPYTVYAFSAKEEVEFRNPAFLQSLNGGLSVHIEDNQEKEIQIKDIIR